MKNVLSVAILATFLAILAGCATTYRAADGNSINGYSEAKISQGVYRVKYTAGTNDTPLVYKFLLRRCAELTIQEGYKAFKVGSVTNGEVKRGLQNVGVGEISIPYYEATVTMFKEQVPDSVLAIDLAR